jgi:endonuclease/exonuclease/phosphatase (EEP) superfamily protein YafD
MLLLLLLFLSQGVVVWLSPTIHSAYRMLLLLLSHCCHRAVWCQATLMPWTLSAPLLQP